MCVNSQGNLILFLGKKLSYLFFNYICKFFFIYLILFFIPKKLLQVVRNKIKKKNHDNRLKNKKKFLSQKMSKKYTKN